MAADFAEEKAALEATLRAQLGEAQAESTSLRRCGLAHRLVICSGGSAKAAGIHRECIRHLTCAAPPPALTTDRRLVAVRTKELAKLRRLAQEVLLQRSDVETFLVSSIHHVRAELAAGALPASPTAAAAAVGAGGSGSRPARSDSEASGSVESVEAEEQAAADPSGAAGGHALAGSASSALGGGALPLDVRQLSWQDRERVLRLLFAKINRAAAAPKLPPPAARTQQLPEAESMLVLPLPLATDAGPAGLALRCVLLCCCCGWLRLQGQFERSV